MTSKDTQINESLSEKRNIKVLSIIAIFCIIFLILYVIDVLSGLSTNEGKITKCYDRYKNVIDNVTCHEIVQCTHLGILFPKCLEVHK